MTNLTTYPNNHNAHTTNVDSFPLRKTYKKTYLETSPTLSFMEVLFKKKKEEREREREKG